MKTLTPQAITAAFMQLDDGVVEDMMRKGKKVQICVWDAREQWAYGSELELELRLCEEVAEQAKERLASLETGIWPATDLPPRPLRDEGVPVEEAVTPVVAAGKGGKRKVADTEKRGGKKRVWKTGSVGSRGAKRKKMDKA